MVTPNPLQQLRDLDRASPQFQSQLVDLLRGDEHQDAVQHLHDEDLTWLVEYLDNILVDTSDPTSIVFQVSLHELRRICRVWGVLPKSCTFSEPLFGISILPTSGSVSGRTVEGSKVCIKRLRTYPERDRQKVKETFLQVAVVWKHLAHPNIVPFLGVTVDPLQLISDWMSGGDLTGYITNRPDADRLGLLSDVAEGLNCIHSCQVIHGDLKGPNILVDTTGRARITDFGLYNVTQNLDSVSGVPAEVRNPARWIAPEILGYQGTYSKEGDVFSFAMVTIEAFTATVPFSNDPSYTAIVSGGRPPRPADPTFTDSLWALTQQCWDQDPHLRPLVSEVLRILRGFGAPTWKRLINRELTTRERVSMITTIFSNRNEVEMLQTLCGEDAQAFIDVVDEALDLPDLTSRFRRKCLRVLCRICGRQALLPKSLQIPQCYNPSELPQYSGGFGEVWMGEYEGRHVAVKVLKVYLTSNFENVRSRFCKEVMTWRTLRHPNVLPLLGVTMGDTHFAMISEWMANGNIKQFVKVHWNANRFELLQDVARGLIYMHSQAMIHGDLKGANILVDQEGHARLADFGLLTIASDSTHLATSNTCGGTLRWMSPELLNPERFGFGNGQPTRGSDCYALGMVILEVLSGKAPFKPYKDLIVVQKVVEGERPERPQGAEGPWFTDGLWETLGQCWSPRPEHRPTIEAVLKRLERVSITWRPLPPCTDDDDVHTASDDESYSTASHSWDRTILHGGDQPAAPPRVHSNGVVDPAVAGGGESWSATPAATSPHQPPTPTQGTGPSPSPKANDNEADLPPVLDNTANSNASTLMEVVGGPGHQSAVRKRKEEIHEMNGHEFVQKQFYQLILCAFCNDLFLNTFGYQCKGCRYTCHKKCYEKVVTNCMSKPNTGDRDEEKINHRIPHRFESVTNLGANWCCHCGYIIPLGRKNARKCSECDIRCHAHCAHLVPDFCGMSMETANQLLSDWRQINRIRRDRTLKRPSPDTLNQGMERMRIQEPPPPHQSPSHDRYGYPQSQPQPQSQQPQQPLPGTYFGPHDHQQAQRPPGARIPIPPAFPFGQQQAMLQQPPPRDDRYSGYDNPQPLPQTPLGVGLPQQRPPQSILLQPQYRQPHPQESQPPPQQQPPAIQQRKSMRKRKVGLDDFDFLAVLGKGDSGKVMLAEEKRTNKFYAIKVLKKEFIIDNDNVESARSEKLVFLTATKERHPFLLALHSCFQTETRVYFVMEYVNGGDLMLHLLRKRFSFRQAKYYASEVLLVLEYFHANGIIHRDLKLDNILLASDGHVKVADYGLCKEDMWYGSTTNTFCGTPEFMAPEILLEQRYNRAVDWWAFGVLMYQMLLGENPFRGDDEDEIFDAILEDEPLYPITMPRDAVSILQKLLTRDPNRRLGSGKGDAEEIKRQPFFKDVVWDDVLHKRIPPPYFPTINGSADISNFNEEFTKEQPTLTPLHGQLSARHQAMFNGFSWSATLAIIQQ